MNPIFAGAVYWVAIFHRQDQWHPRALAVSRALRRARIVTTEEVLVEFLAHFSGFGQMVRERAVRYVEALQADPRLVIEHQSHQSFLDGLSLFKARPDKGYSLTDCISISVMHREKIVEVLTHDNHFAQEGFSLLL